MSGRDNFIILEALATAVVALERLPEREKSKSNIRHMRTLLISRGSGNVSLHLAQAEIRLHPHRCPMDVYREYGLFTD
jgi:hypothetical protein